MTEHDDRLETEATVLCPYCGEINEIGLDPGGGGHQEYVEDCQVCCRPMTLLVTSLDDREVIISVHNDFE